MRVLRYPFAIDAAGAAITVDQWSDAQARGITEAVVRTIRGEREMAPDFGTSDPVARGVDRDELWAAVELCEPDLRVVDVVVDEVAGTVQAVRVSAVWRDDEEGI